MPARGGHTRGTREVVSAIRGVVSELTEFLACSLELDAKRAVCSRAFVLKCIGAEDVNRCDNRDDTDHEDSRQELEESSP